MCLSRDIFPLLARLRTYLHTFFLESSVADRDSRFEGERGGRTQKLPNNGPKTAVKTPFFTNESCKYVIFCVIFSETIVECPAPWSSSDRPSTFISEKRSPSSFFHLIPLLLLRSSISPQRHRRNGRKEKGKDTLPNQQRVFCAISTAHKRYYNCRKKRGQKVSNIANRISTLLRPFCGSCNILQRHLASGWVQYSV